MRHLCTWFRSRRIAIVPLIVPQLITAGAVPACRVEAPGLAPAPEDSSFGGTFLPKPVLRPENWGCSLGLRVSLCSQADGSERPWTNSSLEARLFSTLCACLGQSPREPLKQNSFFPLLPPSLPSYQVCASCQMPASHGVSQRDPFLYGLSKSPS